MKPIGHAIISLGVGSIFYYFSRSITGLSWILAAGVLIDADHYLDYIRERGISFNLKKVYTGMKYAYMDFKKLTLLLHSYELAALLWLCVYMFNLGHVWKFSAIAFTLHILTDQLVNPATPLSYFLWFRGMNNFETAKLFEQSGSFFVCPTAHPEERSDEGSQRSFTR